MTIKRINPSKPSSAQLIGEKIVYCSYCGNRLWPVIYGEQPSHYDTNTGAAVWMGAMECQRRSDGFLAGLSRHTRLRCNFHAARDGRVTKIDYTDQETM